MGSELDNPVWHALTGPHAALAIGGDRARLYPRDITPFAALAEPSPAAYEELAAQLPPGLEARLFRPANEPGPPGWETISVRPILQMVADTIAELNAAEPRLPIQALGSADTGDAIALAEAAKPGPFGPRTMLLGDFIGLRDRAGRLIAMAGERFQFARYVEVSAVAVDPSARGRGIGALLTRTLMRRALSRGLTPFLHVFPDNPAARLYARLGFRERTTLWVLWRRPTASRSGSARLLDRGSRR